MICHGHDFRAVYLGHCAPEAFPTHWVHHYNTGNIGNISFREPDEVISLTAQYANQGNWYLHIETNFWAMQQLVTYTI